MLRESIDLIIDKLNGWIQGFILLLPNILLAIVVVGLVFLLSKSVRRMLYRIIKRFSQNEAVTKLIASSLAGFLIFLSIVLVLNILDLEETVTTLLAGAGIVGLALGLAFQDTLANTFAGIVISVKDLYNIGDHIEVSGKEGVITQIGFRFTQIRTFSGQIVIVPNKTIVSEMVTNFTLEGERRVDIDCSVSYGDDLDLAEKVAVAAIRDNIPHDEERGIDFFYLSYGDSAINFSVRFWVRPNGVHPGFPVARSQGIKAVKKAFEENGLTIPFPIRTLDFGIKGGQSLEKSLAVNGQKQ